MTLEQIFTTYWSQTTLILFGIGFLIKSSIDLSSKKTEINHNLFQQKKLESINSFFQIVLQLPKCGRIFQHIKYWKEK